MTSFTSSFFSTRSSQSKNLPFSGPTVYYGYDSALAAREFKIKRPSPRASMDKDSEAVLANTVGVSSQFVADKAGPIPMRSAEQVAAKASVSVGDSGPKNVTDLVLIVHGIGQAVCSEITLLSCLINFYFIS